MATPLQRPAGNPVDSPAAHSPTGCPIDDSAGNATDIATGSPTGGPTGNPVAAPAAPGAWPVLGHTPVLMRRPLEFVTSLTAHGDVVRIRLGRLPAYAVTHPALVRHVLVDGARDFSRGRLFDKASAFLGEGLAATSGALHRSQRRVIQPAFSRQRIAACVPVMRHVAQSIVSGWVPGRTVAVDHAMNDYSLAVVTRTLLPDSLESRSGEAFQQALPVLTRGMMVRMILPEWWARLPTPGNRRFEQARRTMAELVAEAVAAQRAGRAGMLSVLLAPQEGPAEGEHRLTARQFQDHVTSIAMAGVETTGASLAWFFHELGRHPELEARVHAEVDTVLVGRPPRHEDLPRLEFTTRVILETLRRYAPWLITRRARSPVRLGAVTVPAGAEILYSPYALHHDARWHPDPYRFDPDRWLPDRCRDLPRGAFLPFGAGAHKCIGDAFALTEMTVAAAVICRHWRLRPAPGVRVRAVARAEIHPDALPMVAERR
ncbi:cytochrome P450 [Streptomyces sp. ET3-23]|uniref:cytochrome P450 n=1 Tax=Streptomyces sp. ET3-23 TaxID=2885643 RepID=UPI001D1283C7|nr:cytochrome P450 [Streptomyces sp. ET3-23]MCC2279461.1 cytochrome P450 [Streptomyces sp. ET3-23]